MVVGIASFIFRYGLSPSLLKVFAFACSCNGKREHIDLIPFSIIRPVRTRLVHCSQMPRRQDST